MSETLETPKTISASNSFSCSQSCFWQPSGVSRTRAQSTEDPAGASQTEDDSDIHLPQVNRPLIHNERPSVILLLRTQLMSIKCFVTTFARIASLFLHCFPSTRVSSGSTPFPANIPHRQSMCYWPKNRKIAQSSDGQDFGLITQKIVPRANTRHERNLLSPAQYRQRQPETSPQRTKTLCGKTTSKSHSAGGTLKRRSKIHFYFSRVSGERVGFFDTSTAEKVHPQVSPMPPGKRGGIPNELETRRDRTVRCWPS